MRCAIAAIAVAAVAAVSSGLIAQDTAAVAPGDAVKVTAPSRGLTQWPGEFVRLDGDSVVVRGRGSDSSLAVLPVPAITRFEVNHGNKKSHGHVLKGALIGLGTGVVAGLVIPTDAGCGGDPYCELSADLSKGSQVVLLGAAGALLGAGIGALVRTDPYKTISLRPAVSFLRLPRGRIGVGMQARFRVRARALIRTTWMLVLALASMRAAVLAQDTSLVAPGDPVRVTIPRHGLPRSDYYYFIGFRGDSVVLWNEKHDSSVSVVPFSAIKRFDVNHGDQPPRSQAGKGALVGAGVGLGYAVAQSLIYSCDTDTWICDDAKVIAGFTLFGALTGAIVGALNPAPQYKPVALQPRVAFQPLPGGRVGLGFQLALHP